MKMEIIKCAAIRSSFLRCTYSDVINHLDSLLREVGNPTNQKDQPGYDNKLHRLVRHHFLSSESDKKK